MNLLKSLALFVLVVVVLLALPLLLPSDPARTKLPSAGLPWQIERLPDGATRVFGLVPGRSTLEEARRTLGGMIAVAMIIAKDETGTLEAYDEDYAAGPLTGKLVLSLASTAEQRERMLKRAVKAEYMNSATRRIELAPEDLAAADRAVVTAIAFVPSASLDEAIVLERFGTPAERIRSDATREHFLYPDKGLDLMLDAKGKELLQYVAPGDFARLQAPLRPAQ